MTCSTPRLRLVVPAACLGMMSGCALPVQSELANVSDAARYATRFDHVVGPARNLLDRALAECSEKTSKAENLCVRQALDGSRPSPQAVIAMVPNCRAGQVCHYNSTTRDQLGLVEATATVYVKRWRIDLDFRHPAADAAHVPVNVIDRDDFDSPPAAKTPTAKTPTAKAPAKPDGT